MSDKELYLRVLDRYIAATKHDSNKPIDTFDVIVFLEKEINRYRDKIKKKDERINDLVAQCDALFDITRTKQAQEVTTEQAADGGVMTMPRKTMYWRLVVDALLTNGYFVCSHIDDDNNGETITIEYWRG